VNRQRIAAQPESMLQDLGMAPDTRINAELAMVRDFLNCVRTRNTPAAGIDPAVSADQACVIAEMAVRLGKPLRWDQRHERFIDSGEANRLRVRTMRSPWRV